MGGPKMHKGFSLYLDVIRLGAAMLVLLHHYSMKSEFSGGWLWQFRGFGGAAVNVFFVLSGFVIAYVCARPGYGAAAFTADRIARIMSVALPAIVLTFALDHVGWALRPEAYDGVFIETRGPLTQAVSALLFLNESWFGHIDLGSNKPYWSLPYEVWYYAAFGLALFAPGRWRYAGPALALLVAGPWITAMFPVWLLGCGVYWFGPRVRIPSWAASCIVPATLFGGLGLGIALNATGRVWLEDAGDPVMLGVVAVGVGLNFMAAWHIGPLLLRVLGPAEHLIRLSARMTFTLYLVHLPVMFFIRSLSPWQAASWSNRLLVLFGTLVVAAGLTVLTDHFQAVLRATLREWFGRVRKPRLV